MKKIILINIISIVSIFLFIEFSIRILSNITVHGIAEGIIDESIKPKFNFPNVPGYKVFGKKVFTDDKGFRIVENKLNTNKSLKKIYFIGGSVTFGSGVKQEDTFSGLFGEKNKNLDVHNASVIGSNLSNNSDILKSKIKTSNLEKVYINLSLDDIVENQDLIQEIGTLKRDLANAQNESGHSMFSREPKDKKKNVFRLDSGGSPKSMSSTKLRDSIVTMNPIQLSQDNSLDEIDDNSH